MGILTEPARLLIEVNGRFQTYFGVNNETGLRSMIGMPIRRF